MPRKIRYILKRVNYHKSYNTITSSLPNPSLDSLQCQLTLSRHYACVCVRAHVCVQEDTISEHTQRYKDIKVVSESLGITQRMHTSGHAGA